MTILIAFTGRKSSGKSTATQYLKNLEGFREIKFAGPLKAMLGEFYADLGLSPDQVYEKLEGSLKEVPCEWLGGRTPRFAMQRLGTEWRNLITPDKTLWSSIFKKRVESGQMGSKIVCSDLRFKHEIADVHALGGVAIRIVRPGLIADAASEHISETEIDLLPVDLEIVNDGSVGDLEANLQSLVDLYCRTLTAGMHAA